MLTPKEFNETVQGDGIGFKTTEAKEMMRIPRQAEAQHIELMGDTGAGKTSLIMQILRQIQARVKWLSSTTRPASSFRGFILRSARTSYSILGCPLPYWGPSEELRRKAKRKQLLLLLPADQRQEG